MTRPGIEPLPLALVARDQPDASLSQTFLQLQVYNTHVSEITCK